MEPFTLAVDVTEAARGLIRIEADFPVTPGTTARFTTPLWLCESHVPNGPVSAIAGLSFSANGETLAWRRDPEAAYIFQVDVPEDVHSIHASLETILQDFVTRRMLMLKWETALFHNANISVRHQLVRAAVTMPRAWGFATSLMDDGVEDVSIGDNTTISYNPVTVDRLQDSPILIGKYFKQYPISPDEKHMLCVAFPGHEQAVVHHAILDKFKRLVPEMLTVFGEPPYRNHRFLVMCTDLISPPGGFLGGMEHLECCVITTPTRYLTSPDNLEDNADVFAHEFLHAWNGKYRRAQGHVPNFFNVPLQGNLLWVYEGLTQYYGNVLAVRSGLLLPSAFRAKLAQTASDMQNQAGRIWRSTEDTGTGVLAGLGLGKSRPRQWNNWMRNTDYYFEGVLLWLDADTIIREKTNGDKSLDDFAQRFYKKRAVDGGVDVVPYTQRDIERVLESIVSHDWAAFFQERVLDVAPDINLRGIERAGYAFEYSAEPYESQETETGQLDAIWASIGLRVGKDGSIEDVRRFSPADVAKLAPGATVTHVGEEKYSVNALLDAVRKSKEAPHKVTVRVQHFEDTWDAKIKYDGGVRYAKLRRCGEGRDLLAAIIAPRCDVPSEHGWMYL